jgi:spermidine synthase
VLELPNPFAGEGGLVRLLEPAGSDRGALAERLLAGRYARPFVIEEAGTRSLYFTRDYVQSEMRLAAPYALEFAYTREMMGFLLFVPDPRRILLLGLGGGSLAKYCHRHLPAARVTAVEIDPDVIAFRDQFLLPPDDGRLRVVRDDAAQYVALCEESHDAVLVDAFDRDGVAPALGGLDFYQAVRGGLARRGVMVVNLAGDRLERRAHLDAIEAAFEGNALLVPLAGDGNYVAFAFRDPAFEPRWRQLRAAAQAMGRCDGLDFPALAARLERSRKLGYLGRERQAAR